MERAMKMKTKYPVSGINGKIHYVAPHITANILVEEHALLAASDSGIGGGHKPAPDQRELDSKQFDYTYGEAEDCLFDE